ncbi:MAG TPA: hypothetical protein VFK17_05370 [Gaiellaceae bacterium]|nr:hypothetical protein [Gaiellaceae bacterium]
MGRRRRQLTRAARILPLLAAIVAVGGAGARPASAGGSFARLVGVGANGASVEIRLAASGPRSDASLFAGGAGVAAPQGGYVRLFPLIGGLPGIPGRYYPTARALCWSWHQPDHDCRRADPTARRLLSPLTSLPRWKLEPTTLSRLEYRGRQVRPALDNLLVALELAFDRRPVPADASRPGADAFPFVGRWRGPQAHERPSRFTLGRRGVYSRGLLYPLDRGVWAFVDANRVPAANTRGLTVRSGPPRPQYGIVGPAPAALARIDPRALRPVAGRRVQLDGHGTGWSFSPDRSQIVLGATVSKAELRFVDLRRMRPLGDIAVARDGSVFATTWAGPSRVLAVVLTPGCCGLGDTTVVAVDARSRRVLWRRDLDGSLQAGAQFRRSLALVLGPPGRRLGPSRLALIGPDGRVRHARLDQIRSGSRAEGGRDPARFLVHQWNPGLAVDPKGARAFVVQAAAPIAEIDLRTLDVRYHPLAEPISLLGRLHDWLEPKAQAKAEEGPTRQALWLGNGLLAVTGSDTQASTGASGEQQWATPAGLKLIDTLTWSVRTLDRTTTRATVAAGTLIAYGLLWDSRSQRFSGTGLIGYTLDGDRRYHHYGDDPISAVEPIGDRLIVGGAAGSALFRRGALLDARSGRELRRASFAVTPLTADQPFWY